MAFHPFKHFRKRQKVYLAILTILTMIIFVAQFGAGDPFTRLQAWIGMTTHHGDPVLELYGKKIYAEDLDKLRWRRQLANEFVLSGSGAFNSPMQKTLDDIQKKYGEQPSSNDLTNTTKSVQDALQSMMRAIQAINNSRFQAEPNMLPLRLALSEVQRLLALPGMQKPGNSDQYRAIDAIATNLALQLWAMDMQRQHRNEFYFGGTNRTEDLLDFLIWKQQADRLGIVLTPADVCREINRAWGNGDFLQPDEKLEGNRYVGLFLAGNSKIHKSLTPRDLLIALTDEYRVSMARQAILGRATGVRAYREAVDGIHFSPSVATPDEFYKYFQEQRTTLSVSLLAIPVENFVAKVQAQPSETDLLNLYNRYKEDEPSPSRRQPGFKEPRQIKVQYFSYRPKGEFARKLAAKTTEMLPLFRITQPAGGTLPAVLSMAAGNDLDAFIRAEYDKYRDEETARVLKYDRDDGLSSFSSSRFGQGVVWTESQAAQAQAPAAMVGQLLGSIATGGTEWTGAVSWLATSELYQRATLTGFASAVLSGTSTSPFVAATLPTRYYHTVQPLEAVRKQMIERFETNLASRIMDANVAEVRKEINKQLDSHSQEKLDEYLKKAVAEHGLENFHSMAGLQTRQEIQDKPDPVLKELRQAYDDSRDDPLNPFKQFALDQARPDFVAALFDLGTMERQFPPLAREARIRQFRSRSEDVAWMYWRAEDKPAHVREFEAVRKEVQNAWYLEQARRLARAEANRINEELSKHRDNTEDAVRFLLEQKQGRVFQLDNVAHLIAPIFNLPDRQARGKYSDYVPPREEVPYPPPDFVTQLLKLKKRGESRVLADKPVQHFYVAVLRENPLLPDRREFTDAYNTHGEDNRLWNEMMQARQRQYEQQIMEQLRAEATKSLKAGEYELPDNLRGRGESSSDSAE